MHYHQQLAAVGAFLLTLFGSFTVASIVRTNNTYRLFDWPHLLTGIGAGVMLYGVLCS